MGQCALVSQVSNAAPAIIALMFHLIPTHQEPANLFQNQPALFQEKSAVALLLSPAAKAMTVSMLQENLLRQVLASCRKLNV